MPTFGSHYPDDLADAVKAAAKVSAEKKVGPWITEAVRQRLEREGLLQNNPQAELLAAGEAIGLSEAIEVLKRAARRRHLVPTAA